MSSTILIQTQEVFLAYIKKAMIEISEYFFNICVS